MTDTPTPQDPGQTPVYTPPGGAPAPMPASTPLPPAQQIVSAPAAATPAVPAAGVTSGAAAPHSEMEPGRGTPMVAGAPMSVRGPMSAKGLNITFLLFGIIGLVIAVLLVFWVIHLIFK